MTANDMNRWGGPLTMLGGLLLVFAIAVNFIGESRWGFHALNAPPNALLAPGIVGLYLNLRQQGKLKGSHLLLCVTKAKKRASEPT